MIMHPWLSEWSSWLWPNVVVHLWETTLFVGLLALGVRLLKRAPASTRYRFWLLAAVKLLVPSVLLAWLVSEISPVGHQPYPLRPWNNQPMGLRRPTREDPSMKSSSHSS